MNKYIMTFMLKQFDHPGRYTIIEAESIGEAHKIVYQLFGDQFAFMYTQERWTKINEEAKQAGFQLEAYMPINEAFEALVGHPFEEGYKRLVGTINRTAHTKGWWPEVPTDRNEAEIIALIHSELSEGLEALRAGNPPDSHLGDEGFSGIEVELADVVIRIMDYAETFGYNVAGAITSKALYNVSRGFKHGGKSF